MIAWLWGCPGAGGQGFGRSGKRPGALKASAWNKTPIATNASNPIG